MCSYKQESTKERGERWDKKPLHFSDAMFLRESLGLLDPSERIELKEAIVHTFFIECQNIILKVKLYMGKEDEKY